MNVLSERVTHAFHNRFGDEHILVRSPGRVNLIGEHTDYNEGFALPAAIDNCIILAINVNHTNKVRFYAIDKGESYEADISDALTKSDLGWPNYLLGVIDQLSAHGYECPGFDCVFGGNVPIGAGLSSSAALEGGILYGLNQRMQWDIDPVQMAHIAQKAENQFVGVQCGIMDQFASLMGKKDHVMRLDCRSLDYEFYPFERQDLYIVLCDTQIRRELASSEYNVRRQQCETGVQKLQQYDAGIKSLRDVTTPFLEEHKDDLSPVIYERCRYIIEENQRVLDACANLQKNDWLAFGKLMYASHNGLRDQYEVSCKELDILVELAARQKGVLGARMMGGGFGGCTINLVEEKYFDTFKEEMKQKYTRQTDRQIKVYQTRVSPGTHLIEPQKMETKQ